MDLMDYDVIKRKVNGNWEYARYFGKDENNKLRFISLEDGKEFLLDEDLNGWEKVEEVRLDREQLISIARHMNDIKDYIPDASFGRFTSEYVYDFTLEDLLIACKNLQNCNPGEIIEWCIVVCDELYENLLSNLGEDQEFTYEGIPTENEFLYNMISNILDWYSSDTGNIGEIIRNNIKNIESHLNGNYSDYEKRSYISYWNHNKCSIDEEHKKLYKQFVDEYCEQNDKDMLELKAYACYGNGNGIYEQDWQESMSCLLKLMDMECDPYIANTLGYMYYYGRCNNGIPEYDKAFYYFSIGSAGYVYESRYKLADMFLNGYGVKQNRRLALHMYNELYNETIKNILTEEYDSRFADVAFRLGSYMEKDQDYDYRLALDFYLQARFALRKRMEEVDQYGDYSIATSLDHSIDRMIDKINCQKKHKSYQTDLIGQLVNTDYSKGYFYEAKVISSNDKTLLKIKIVQRDGEHMNLLVTIPEMHYCDVLDEITLELKNINELSVELKEDTFIFDEINFNSFYLYGNYLGEIDAQFVFTNPHQEQTYTFVEVSFDDNKTYTYISDDVVQVGDIVLVDDKEVKVCRVIEKSEYDVSMPIDKYKHVQKL
ncbi:tetratricopeptide repeat protein [Floccifex sp.]|uniref:tetratricopeptide repeat protein n=1 Tax=Floccifex sp. TaxID=2815810 RepID=UPI002A763FDD|nr:hypothetical protein [Floccifex sp.]MDD7281926.1 hypothetical protein [Erysipelotrichaceae bacterium]MDY2958136.1 hypothetical protein [Floccifex sp.]